MARSSLISIVVPVYGVDEYLEQCVDSILTQTFRDLEIILVDDGSPDRSPRICDEFAARDRRVRVVHKPNGGLVSARKAGTAVASGEFLGFVDGDDWVGADYFEALHDEAATQSADMVIAGHTREFLGKCEVIPPRIPGGAFQRAEVLDTLLPTAIYNGTFFQHGVSTYVWNKLFRRRKAARLVGDIHDAIVMGEDAALTYPYLAESERVAICKVEAYFYRQRAHSIVKTVPSREREYYQLSMLFQYLKRKFGEASVSAVTLDQLRHYFYAQVLIRSGAIIEPLDGDEILIPFAGIEPGQKVVVCSSGSFGQHVVREIGRIPEYSLVGWIDEDDDESQRSGLPVTAIDSVSAMDFDKILIAAIDSEYSDVVASRLTSHGIDESKISRLAVDFGRLDSFLQRIGFDPDSFVYSPDSVAQPAPMRALGRLDA